MTSGVYPRKPDRKRAGPPKRFTKAEIALIKLGPATGKSIKWLSSKWQASEKTISRVLNGTGAYKGM